MLNTIHLLPAFSVERKPPKNLVYGDEIYFKHEYIRSFGEVMARNIKYCSLTEEGLVYKNWKLQIDSLITPEFKNQYGLKYFIKKIVLGEKHHVLKTKRYVHIFNAWSQGYAHWMGDALPKIVLIKPFLNADDVILIPKSHQLTFVIETLKLLGIKNIEFFNGPSCPGIQRLLFVQHIGISGNYHPQTMNALRHEFYLNVKEQKTPQKKIYISRKKARWRFVLNEDEIVKMLSKYGFESHCLEDYTILEQLQLLHDTSHLISIHGAGLTNLIFMPSGTRVLELRKNNDGANNMYLSLANALDIEYYYQNCDYIDRRNGNYFDLSPDIQVLEENILKMLAT